MSPLASRGANHGERSMALKKTHSGATAVELKSCNFDRWNTPNRGGSSRPTKRRLRRLQTASWPGRKRRLEYSVSLKITFTTVDILVHACVHDLGAPNELGIWRKLYRARATNFAVGHSWEDLWISVLPWCPPFHVKQLQYCTSLLGRSPGTEQGMSSLFLVLALSRSALALVSLAASPAWPGSKTRDNKPSPALFA
jgi:hypothetical protein